MINEKGLSFAFPENSTKLIHVILLPQMHLASMLLMFLRKSDHLLFQAITTVTWKNKALDESLKGALWYPMLNVESRHHLIALIVSNTYFRLANMTGK